jgi:hypothetical protein
MTRSTKLWITGVAGLLILVAASVYEWRRRHIAHGTDDALARFASPFLNTRPGASYVGTSRCAGCHNQEAATFAEHPMGRSVSVAGQWLPKQGAAASSFHASGLSYAVERRADRIVHREFATGSDGRVQAEVSAEVVYALGSGRQGQSFLLNERGYLFQSPISWYSRENAWQLSPGYERMNQHFNRYIIEECLFCHVNEAHAEPGSLNRYRSPRLELESIGCERCHGPGSLHVAAHEDGDGPAGEDLTIVNPRHLEPRLREAICEQCHLQGEARVARRGHSLYDYRPGLPLQEFMSVYVHPPEHVDARAAVSQPEQIQRSRCFQASAGKMGCISCHDPHAIPSTIERVSWYRDRCLSCHQDTSCSLPSRERRKQNAADSCFHCHMPRAEGSNVAHTAVTDHRIPRQDDSGRAVQPKENPDATALILFPDGGTHQAGGDKARDLGLALVVLSRKPSPESVRRFLFRRACALLAETVKGTPDDVPALEGLGIALCEGKASGEALDTLEKVLQQEPRRELALEMAARAAMQVGDAERGLAYWRRLVEVNPYRSEGRAFLAQALAQREKWAAAVDECRASLHLDPFDRRPRMLLIDCLVRLGMQQHAREEFEILLTVCPADANELRQWFGKLLPSTP